MKKKWNTVNKWTPNYVTIFFIFCTNAVWTQDVYPVNYSCGLENHPQMWKELLGPGFVGGFFETMVTSHKYKKIFCMWLFVTPPPILYYASIINFDRTARWTCSIKMECLSFNTNILIMVSAWSGKASAWSNRSRLNRIEITAAAADRTPLGVLKSGISGTRGNVLII